MTAIRMLSLIAALLSIGAEARASLPGLLAEYRLDGSGEDSSGNARHGTVIGDPTTTFNRCGCAAKAMQFDGADDFVQLDEHTAFLQPPHISISAWFRADTLSVGPKVVVRSRWYAYNLAIDNAGALWADIWTDQGNELLGIHTGAFRDGRWHHAAITFDGTRMGLWIDGELAEEQTAVVGGPIFYSPGGIAIGRDGDAEWYFHGGIDNVRLFDRALVAEEVAELAREEFCDGFESGDLEAWSGRELGEVLTVSDDLGLAAGPLAELGSPAMAK